MADFPVDAYLRARQFQVNRQEQNDPANMFGALGGGIGEGMKMGMMGAQQQAQQLRQMRGEVFKDLITKNMLVDETGTPVGVDQIAKAHQDFVTNGQIDPHIKPVPIKQPGIYMYDDPNNPSAPAKPIVDEKGKPVSTNNKIIKPVATGAGGASSAGLNKEAIADQAWNYLNTNKLPTLGMGAKAAGDREAVLNQSSKLRRELKLGLDEILVDQAQYGADTKSLQHLTTQMDNILAFENTTDANFDVAQHLSGQVTRTPVPMLNKYILAGETKGLGDVNAAKFAAAVITAKNEYVKVVTSVTGGGAATSDAARKEADGLIDAAQTYDQLAGVIKTLKQEMENRRLGYEKQRTAMVNRMRSRIPTGAVPQQVSPAQPNSAIPSNQQQNNDPLGLGIGG